MRQHISENRFASDSLGLVVDWTHALNENGDLADVLGRLICLVKADAAMIVRSSKEDGKTSYLARCCAETGKVWPVQPRSQARAILGDSMSTAKSGSIWKMSDSASSGLNAACFNGDDYADSVVEVIVSPMETTCGHTDHLEFHFRHRPAEHDLNLVIMLIGTLAVSWKRRVPGIISKKLGQKLKPHLYAGEERIHVPILDTENPAQLSRCEFRVCSLLNEGMTVNSISQALSISQATVRSHLSSIFSKTNVSNQIELLHRLNSKAEPLSDCDSAKRPQYS